MSTSSRGGSFIAFLPGHLGSLLATRVDEGTQMLRSGNRGGGGNACTSADGRGCSDAEVCVGGSWKSCPGGYWLRFPDGATATHMLRPTGLWHSGRAQSGGKCSVLRAPNQHPHSGTPLRPPLPFPAGLRRSGHAPPGGKCSSPTGPYPTPSCCSSTALPWRAIPLTQWCCLPRYN